MHALVLTTVLPGERRGGGEIVTQGVIDAIAEAGCQVRTIGYRRPGTSDPISEGELCVGERPIETSTAGPRSAAWMASSLVRRLPYSVAKYRSRAYLRAVREALEEGPRVVIGDHAQTHFAMAEALRWPAPLVFIAHNAEGDAYSRLAAQTHGRAHRKVLSREARLIGRLEADLVGRANQVWALTEEDSKHLMSISTGVDVRTLHVASHVAPVDSAPPECDVALIGNWSWAANERGLRWFSDEVAPRMDRGMSIEIAGAGADWLRGRHPNVRVHGRVPDARKFLSRARATAVPSTAGGGVQIKTLDAIASGLPVVATCPAVRGLAELPHSVAVTDDPTAFAAELERFAGESDCERPRAEAVAWSRARDRLFRANVAAWLSEVAPA